MKRNILFILTVIVTLFGCKFGYTGEEGVPAGYYTITFHGNGNTSGAVPVRSTYYPPNFYIQLIADGKGSLVKEGYYFSHWNTEADGTGQAYYVWVEGGTRLDSTYHSDYFYMPAHNVDLFAIWCENGRKYSVVYDTSAFPDVAPINDSNTYWPFDDVKIKTTTRPGYSLSWNTIPDGSGKRYVPTSPRGSDMPCSDLILYPIWDKNNYSIQYFANGATSGSVPIDSTIYSYNDEGTVLGNIGGLLRDGYYFNGWSTTLISSSNLIPPGQKLIMTGSYRLHAVWEVPQTTSIFGTYDAWTYTDLSGWLKVENQQLVVQTASLTMAGNTIFPATGILTNQKLGIVDNQIYIAGTSTSGDFLVYLYDYILEDSSRFGTNILWLKTDNTSTNSIGTAPNLENLLTSQILCYIKTGSTPGKVISPVFSPIGGRYSTDQIISINTLTNGANIYYTIDDTDPSVTNGILYNDPITLSSSQTIKAIACKEGLDNSEIVSSKYFIRELSPPISNGAGCLFHGSFTLILTSEENANIRYTLTRETPTESFGEIYTGPVTFFATQWKPAVNIRAIAYKEGWITSPIREDFAILMD